MTRPHYDYEDRGARWRFESRITPGVRLLLLANVIAFILAKLLEIPLMSGAPAGAVSPIPLIFGVSRGAVFERFRVWQPLTYLFVHGGVLHLLWNMFALWVFGCDVERAWGTRRFFFYYFFTGVGAGLCILLFGERYIPTIGASGAVLGVLVAFAMLFPNRLITLLLLFVFPLTLKAKHLAIGCALVTFLFLVSGSGGGVVSHLCHFGGMVLGYLYVRYSDVSRSRFDDFVSALSSRRVRQPRVRRRPMDTYTTEDIDAILDKIAAQGIDSLTEREKDMLRKASSRMR